MKEETREKTKVRIVINQKWLPKRVVIAVPEGRVTNVETIVTVMRER